MKMKIIKKKEISANFKWDRNSLLYKTLHTSQAEKEKKIGKNIVFGGMLETNTTEYYYQWNKLLNYCSSPLPHVLVRII